MEKLYGIIILMLVIFLANQVKALNIEEIKSKLEPNRTIEYINVKDKKIPLITSGQNKKFKKDTFNLTEDKTSYIIAYKGFLHKADINNIVKVLKDNNLQDATVFKQGPYISLHLSYNRLKSLFESLLNVVDVDYVEETPAKYFDSNVKRYKSSFDRSIAQEEITQYSPNDPLFKNQWYLNNSNNPLIDLGYLGFRKYLINSASKIVQNNNPPVVALIDVGIFYSTPELEDRVYVNKNEIPDNNIDDDNNGYVDDYMGVDVAHLDCTLKRCIDKYKQHHGTSMFSIIAAKSDNNLYMTGIVPDEVKVLPVSASKDYEHVDMYNEAYDYILDMKKKGVNIVGVNVSAGGPFDPVEYDYMQKYLENNIVVVAAVGNEGDNIDRTRKENLFSIDDTKAYPAKYKVDNILAVGAIDEEGNPAYFSNYGKVVDLYMPGVKITSLAYPEGLVMEGSGTSQATAVTSGVLGVAAYLYPNCSAVQLRDMILETALHYASFSVLRRIGIFTLPINKNTYEINLAKISDINGFGLITDGKLQPNACIESGIGR